MKKTFLLLALLPATAALAQNVGIGTTTPGAKLDITASGTVLTGTAHSNTLKTMTGVLGTGSSNELSLGSFGYLDGSNHTGFGVKAYRNNSGRHAILLEMDKDDEKRVKGGYLAIGSLGNIGIHESDPTARLHVNGTTYLNGSMGIGTNLPVTKLDVIGTTYISGNVGIGTSNVSGSTRLRVNGNGQVIDIRGGDHAFFGLYLEQVSSARAGFIGYPEAGIHHIWIKNELDQGNISLLPGARGNVGIGAGYPTKGRLEVEGFKNYSVGSFVYFNNNTALLYKSDDNGGGTSISIYATSDIVGRQIMAFSDARIKNIKGISDRAKDLQTLASLQVTDYTMKDSLMDSKRHKKVIAQQVEQVYPQAVSKNPGTVPDIYTLAELNDGWVNLKTNLQKGEKVKLYFESKSDVYEVQEVSAAGFRIHGAENGKVFVYGREVPDFRTVDYDALAMLNISATQELLKRIERLEQENSTLKASVEEVRVLKNDLMALKAMLPQ